MWFYYDYSYTSETWNETEVARDKELEGLAPSRHYSNFSVGLQLPNALDIDFIVNNVTNENSYGYVWRGEGGSADTFGDPRYQQQVAQDRPRTYWLTLRKGFGNQ